MTFVGPGSEWFWSAVSGLVVAATLLVIYRQLREQRASALYEQMAAWERDYDDLDFGVTRLRALLEFENRATAEGLPFSFQQVGTYYERLGYLVNQGHLRADHVWQSLRPGIGWWWALASPYIERQRALENFPNLFDQFENLEQEMRRLDRLHGQPMTFEVSAEDLASRIDELTDQLRLRLDIHKGKLPSRRDGSKPRRETAG